MASINVGNIPTRADRRTDDQKMYLLVSGLDGLAEGLTDLSPEVIDYALDQLALARRSLLQAKRDRSVTCASCEESFVPIRSTAVYCSGACRTRAHRERNDTQPSQERAR